MAIENIKLELSKFNDIFCTHCNNRNNGIIGYKLLENIDHFYTICIYCEKPILIINGQFSRNLSTENIIEKFGSANYLKLFRSMVQLKRDLREQGIHI